MLQCVGVRFAVGKLVELLYVDASLSNPSNRNEISLALDSTKFTFNRNGMDVLRASLGHPLNTYPYSARCVVSSVHGLDSASSPDRFMVASRLWIEGISAEYLAQSGVMASILKRQREESRGIDASVSKASTRKHGSEIEIVFLIS